MATQELSLYDLELFTRVMRTEEAKMDKMADDALPDVAREIVQREKSFNQTVIDKSAAKLRTMGNVEANYDAANHEVEMIQAEIADTMAMLNNRLETAQGRVVAVQEKKDLAARLAEYVKMPLSDGRIAAAYKKYFLLVHEVKTVRESLSNLETEQAQLTAQYRGDPRSTVEEKSKTRIVTVQDELNRIAASRADLSSRLLTLLGNKSIQPRYDELLDIELRDSPRYGLVDNAMDAIKAIVAEFLARGVDLSGIEIFKRTKSHPQGRVSDPEDDSEAGLERELGHMESELITATDEVQLGLKRTRAGSMANID